MKKIFFLIIIVSISISAFSQSNINDYKYVLVPQKFDFLNEANQYQLNELSTFLFNKYGFTAFNEGDTLPDDAILNGCLVLKTNVLKEKSLFKTKLTIQLKNCRDEVVYTSNIGESKEKDYKVAYNFALREAFNSIKNLNYSYSNKAIESPKVSTQSEIEKLKAEIKTLKKETPELTVVSKEKELNTIKVKENLKPQEASKTEDTALYAVAIDNGFKLATKTNNKEITIYYSSLKDVYIVKDKDAIIYKKNESWFYSESNGNSINAKVIDIRF